LVTSEQVEITPQGTYKFTYDQIQKLNVRISSLSNSQISICIIMSA